MSILKKPAAAPKALMAKAAGNFGCPKCRHSKTGCLKCNPEKTARWLAKKEAKEQAEAEDAKAEATEKKAQKLAKAKGIASKAASKDGKHIVEAEADNDNDDGDDNDDNGVGKWEPPVDTEAILDISPDKEEDDVDGEGSAG